MEAATAAPPATKTPPASTPPAGGASTSTQPQPEKPKGTTEAQYAVFKVVDHNGEKAWLPVSTDEEGEPGSYPGKTRREAIKAAIREGDAELGGGPYYAVPKSKIGPPENPKPPEDPAVRW